MKLIRLTKLRQKLQKRRNLIKNSPSELYFAMAHQTYDDDCFKFQIEDPFPSAFVKINNNTGEVYKDILDPDETTRYYGNACDNEDNFVTEVEPLLDYMDIFERNKQNLAPRHIKRFLNRYEKVRGQE